MLEREKEIERIKSAPERALADAAELEKQWAKQKAEHLQQIDDAVIDTFRRYNTSCDIVPPTEARVRFPASTSTCLNCHGPSAQGFKCESVELCRANMVLAHWARNCPPETLPPLGIFHSEEEKRKFNWQLGHHPERNAAAVLLTNLSPTRHMRTLLQAVPELLTPHLIYAMVSRGDSNALRLLQELSKEDDATFWRRIWKEHQHDFPSVLHVCINADRLKFLRAQLIEPLRKAVGDEETRKIISPLFNHRSTKAPSPAYYAVVHTVRPLLQIIVELNLDGEFFHPIKEAASEVRSLPSLRCLVDLGANLNPIWPLLKSDRKLAWLFSWILDTFWEQGSQCRNNERCFIYKLSSPQIQAHIMSFLWAGVRRPSFAKQEKIGGRYWPRPTIVIPVAGGRLIVERLPPQPPATIPSSRAPAAASSAAHPFEPEETATTRTSSTSSESDDEAQDKNSVTASSTWTPAADSSEWVAAPVDFAPPRRFNFPRRDKPRSASASESAADYVVTTVAGPGDVHAGVSFKPGSPGFFLKHANS